MNTYTTEARSPKESRESDRTQGRKEMKMRSEREGKNFTGVNLREKCRARKKLGATSERMGETRRAENATLALSSPWSSAHG